MSDVNRVLESAWSWRAARPFTGALRVFHGPGEAPPRHPLSFVAIDRFADHYWVTEWEGGAAARAEGEIVEFLASKGAASAVALWRPQKGVPAEPVAILGPPPSGSFTVSEPGSLRFEIQLLGSRHPGLFLDHAPLRQWLLARARGWKVLNGFAYTGSLSVAAGVGGAEHVTTLDLAKPAIEWAQRNWSLNGLAEERARFIAGDVFEWLPRLKREGKSFDCVILDPPSFSRGKEGRQFSTQKDLERLHGLAMDLLAPRGVLVTSINSANVSWARYEDDVLAAARARKKSFELLGRIDLPDTFPTRFGGDPSERYLKGFILRSVGS